MNISQALQDKIDTIIQQWIDAVRQDGEIPKARELTYQAVLNHLPGTLQSLVTLLSDSEENDIDGLIESSLEHGALRAQQGYDAEEIAREYRLLRQVLFTNLESDLLQGTSQQILRAVRIIDTAIDEVIAKCFHSYTQERLHELETFYSQLQLTNQELTRLVAAHQDNISKLAHELKNPLTSIIGYSDLFLRQQRQQKEVRDPSFNLGHIERVLQNGRQLLHLINDTLEVSRYKAGKMKLRPANTDICAVINLAIEALQPLAAQKGLELLVSCALSSNAVTDPLRLQQVLTNLISNAIRYTETGRVKVNGQMLSEDRLAITVSDTGIGIKLEEQSRLFEPFYQAGFESNRPPDSTGLGLTIVSQLVELLQGEIQLVSQVGEGTTFTVLLPMQVEEDAGGTPAEGLCDEVTSPHSPSLAYI